MSDPPSDPTVDIRLIPEFSGSSHSVSEWLDKLELICELRGITGLHNIVPLRLTSGAFAVYQQLSSSDKKDYKKIKDALLLAFAVDQFCAYEQFISRKLGDSEPVDVYLADLRRLAGLFGGLPDTGLICAFVAGLPESVRRMLRAGSRIESMDITQILNRARAMLVEEEAGTVLAGVEGATNVTCRRCGQPNHYARDCLMRSEWRNEGSRSRRGRVRCFRCGIRGHVASSCSGNLVGEGVSAPASSPIPQQ